MCNKTEQSVIIGPSVSFEELCLFLKQTEYERVSKVTDVKQFCIKGGIVDFYSPTQQAPIRAYFYDDSPRFVYYNLLTGFPENSPIKQVSLNKKGKKTFETKINSIVQKKGFVVIDANKKTNKTIKVVELKDEAFQKIKKEIHYLTKIQYSAYQFNNHIYAPSVYKNIKEQKSKNISFVPGFERGTLFVMKILVLVSLWDL